MSCGYYILIKRRVHPHSGHGDGDLQTIEDKLSQGALWEEWGEAGQALTQPSAARGQIVRILRDYLCLKSISCPLSCVQVLGAD